MSGSADDLIAYLEAYDEHARQCGNNAGGPPGSGICAILELCARQFSGWPPQPEGSKPQAEAEAEKEARPLPEWTDDDSRRGQ